METLIHQAGLVRVSMRSTTIGDAVNLASRIEGRNKGFGTLALASGDASAATDGRFITRSMGGARVVGRTEPVAPHELLATRDEKKRSDAALLDAFAAARAEFEAGRFAPAAAGLGAALELTGGKDGPSAFFLKYAVRLAAQPPASWDGVAAFESKSTSLAQYSPSFVRIFLLRSRAIHPEGLLSFEGTRSV